MSFLPVIRGVKMATGINEELRVRILDGAAKLFDTKGIRFTMDDLARSLGMSKKTIYTVFRNKRSIMMETIDRFFDDALAEEKLILADDSLATTEKLIKVIGSVPERYVQKDLSQLSILKKKYPSVYRHWKKCRESYWAGAEALLRQGIDEGTIRPISLPIFQTMFQSTISQFFQGDVLIKNKISYQDALAEVATTLVNGIAVK